MSSTGSGYDQGVTTYSPDGKLYQVEYAQQAINGSGTAIGVRCKDGVILGVEKLVMSKMLVKGSGRRIATIDEHIGAATAGHMPDAHHLVSHARSEAASYRKNYGDIAPPRVLAERVAGYVHAHTVYWYMRPFGISMLMAAYDAETKTPELYCVDPTGMVMRYRGYAVGKGARAAKTDIEKYKFEEKSVEEGIKYLAKILHTVHDDTKDKPMEVELSWVCEATGWRHAMVPADKVAAASAWAKAEIEREEDEDDDDDDDDE